MLQVKGSAPDSSTLSDEVEQDGDYNSVRHKWRVNPDNAPDALEFGRRKPDGELVGGDWTLFRVGDLIEVIATIDVAVMRNQRYHIHLRPRRINLLAQGSATPASTTTAMVSGNHRVDSFS